MASPITLLYGTSNQAITLTQASLASAAARASTFIDNTANLWEDILVQFIDKSGASGTSASGFIQYFATGSADGGTTYGEGATGTDAAITLTNPPNVKLIGTVNMVANATTYKSTVMSVAAAFGGTLPPKVVIILSNQSGHALDVTGGNFSAFYIGVAHQA